MKKKNCTLFIYAPFMLAQAQQQNSGTKDF